MDESRARATKVVRRDPEGRGTLGAWTLLVTLVWVAGLAGCASYPIPMSVQAGSTIAIPVRSNGGSGEVIGYGGFHYTDNQRGTMIYQLDGPGGFELETRVTLEAEPSTASLVSGSTAVFSNPPQVVSIVDIPDDAPEGEHTLHIIRRMPDGTEFPGPSYSPTITILPHNILLSDGVTTVEGEVTYSALANCTWQCGFGHLVDDVVPRPRVRIRLNAGSVQIGAFEMGVSYPDAIINVLDAIDRHQAVFKSLNDRGTVWLDDDGAGLAQVSGVAHPDSGGQGLVNWYIDIVFGLDGTQILDLVADPTAVQATVVAYDLDGNVIPGATANVEGIW